MVGFEEARQRAHRLFDETWYVDAHPDVRGTGTSPFEHFITEGARRGLRPNPLFDTSWYIARYGHVAGWQDEWRELDPLSHFAAHEASHGLRPCALFDTVWYRKTYPAVRVSGMNPLAHFQAFGAAEHLRPNRFFDTRWYLQCYPDARTGRLDPLSHYVERGAAQGYWPNPLFDSRWYANRNAEALRDGMNPLAHFASTGLDEACQPNILFDTRAYLDRNESARASHRDPLSHYMEVGAAAGLSPSRFFDADWYAATNMAGAQPGTNPLAHFLKARSEAPLAPNPIFDPTAYAAFCRAEGIDTPDPLVAYLESDRNFCGPAYRARQQRSGGGNGSRLLYIDSYYPRPHNDSGSLDAIQYLSILLDLGFAVTFVPCAELFGRNENRERLEAMGVDCVDHYKFGSVEELIRRCGATFSVFFLSRIDCGGHNYELARSVAPDARFIFNTVDLHHVREAREARLTGNDAALRQSQWVRERELYLARKCDATIVVSQTEHASLQQDVPGAPVHLVPLLRDIPGSSRGFGERHGVGFIGGFRHRPNLDGVLYFLDRIWPLVLAQVPSLTFHIFGADIPDEIRLRPDQNIVIEGHVVDIARAFDRVRLTVAPLRFGAGAKGKVVSSLAHGVPCVGTPVSAEGLALVPGQDIVLATDPEGLAQAVVLVHEDEARWTALSSAGLRAVGRDNDVKMGKERFRRLFHAIGIHLDEPSRVVN